MDRQQRTALANNGRADCSAAHSGPRGRAQPGKPVRLAVGLAMSALALGTVCVQTHAASLGRLTLFSAQGEPLDARIEVADTARGATEATVGLAAREAYERFRLLYPPEAAAFSIERLVSPGSRSLWHLRSQIPLERAVISVLLELSVGATSVFRVYTFTLDEQ